jgi:ADP-ribose pyrophosphatase YjhB (NUDIX family)
MSKIYRSVQVVVGLVEHAGKLLLIRQQGPRDPAPYWTLPSGKVEEGELLWEALTREMREETGLEVHAPFKLAYVAQCLSDQRKTHWTSFAFEIADWSGELAPQDPDGLVSEACFFERDEALGLIEKHQPLRVMMEPPLAHLRGESYAGAMWFYHQDELGFQNRLAEGKLNRIP